MRAEAIVQRGDGRIGCLVWSHAIAADAKEAIWREAEEQRFHDRYAAEWLDKDVCVRGPPTQCQTVIAPRVARDRLGLTHATSTLQELEVGGLLLLLAATEIQRAAQAQTEDAGVAGETESAEEWIGGLLMPRRITFEHHRSLSQQESRRRQGHNDGGANQEQ